MPSYEAVTQRAGSVQAMTGFTHQAFEALLPHVEPALAAYWPDRTMDGQARPSRRDRPYDQCPLPTRADPRLCMLTSVQQHPLQEVPGPLLGMSQSKANTWMHVRHPVLHQAFTAQARLPARTAAECAALFATPSTDGRSTPPFWA